MKISNGTQQSFAGLRGYASLTTSLYSESTLKASRNAMSRLSALGSDDLTMRVEAEFAEEATNKNPILNGNLIVSAYKEEKMTFLEVLKSMFIPYSFKEVINRIELPVKVVDNQREMEEKIYYTGLEILKKLSSKNK